MRDFSEWKPRCIPPRNLVQPVRCDPSGRTGPTRGQARSKKWRRSSQGFYVPSEVDATVPEQRILEMAVHLPADGAITGWAACRWAGAGYFDGLAADGRAPLPVALAIGPDRDLRDRPGVRLSRDRLPADDVVVRSGLRCTSVERAVFDEMRWASDLREAVVAMDMVAAAELTSIQRLRRHLQGKQGWNGRPQVEQALDLADERSMSPNETRMRLVWVLDAGLPPPLTNQPVFDHRGILLGVADLLDPVAGVVGEYDGAAHRTARRHQRDIGREDRFRRAGLEYFTVVGLDLADVGLVVDRMVAARRRAGFAAPGDRRWTLTAPPGWSDDPLDAMTLDQLLDHQDWLRSLDDSHELPAG